jgi:hypothetical protein
MATVLLECLPLSPAELDCGGNAAQSAVSCEPFTYGANFDINRIFKAILRPPCCWDSGFYPYWPNIDGNTVSAGESEGGLAEPPQTTGSRGEAIFLFHDRDEFATL